MAKIRQRDKDSVMNALAGGVTPRQGIQFIQVGRKQETEALLNDIKRVESGESSFRILNSTFGGGKSCILSTPVLTEHGWIPIGQINIGDKVYTRNGTLATVTDTYDYNAETYLLELVDGRQVECCANHLWIVEIPRSRNDKSEVTHHEKVMTTQHIAKLLENNSYSTVSIPYIQPPQFRHQLLPVDPYVLGVFIGDGSGKSIPLSLTSADQYIVNKVAKLLDTEAYKQACKYHWCFINKNYNDTKSITHNNKKLLHTADVFAGVDGYIGLYSHEKYIDERYLWGDVQQRMSLLQGLLDTDGSGALGRVEFTTTSHKLAEQVQYLVRSLGMTGTITADNRTKYHSADHRCYSVSIFGSTSDVFTLPRKQNDVIAYINNRKSSRRIRMSQSVPIKSITATGKKADMRCLAVDDDSHSYVIKDFVMTHNTFMLTLTKTVALKRNLMVMQCDLSPDRRLYSSDGKAKELYKELVRSLSSATSPDGGALDELLNALDEQISIGNTDFVHEIRKLPYGYDAITVLNKWHIALHPITEKEKRDAAIVQDACLRWFAAENTVEHKKLLGVRSSIKDDGAYDALKLIAMLSHYAGYKGLMVELDECVNLYKINNSATRDRNYEQILRMFNESRQGDAHYIGFVLAGTPEFVMDTRRGLFSYDALKSRLMMSQYAKQDGTVDPSSPIIDLLPMPVESLFVLLKNIVNVDALGDESKYVMTDDDIKHFLEKCSNTLGADFYQTPRDIIRDFVTIIGRLEASPELKASDIIDNAELTTQRRESGLGQTMKESHNESTENKASHRNIDGSMARLSIPKHDDAEAVSVQHDNRNQYADIDISDDEGEYGF